MPITLTTVMSMSNLTMITHTTWSWLTFLILVFLVGQRLKQNHAHAHNNGHEDVRDRHHELETTDKLAICQIIIMVFLGGSVMTGQRSGGLGNEVKADTTTAMPATTTARDIYIYQATL